MFGHPPMLRRFDWFMQTWHPACSITDNIACPPIWWDDKHPISRTGGVIGLPARPLSTAQRELMYGVHHRCVETSFSSAPEGTQKNGEAIIRTVMQPGGTGRTVSRARCLGFVVCLSLTGTATAIAQSSGTFVKTGSMAVARAQHSATLLADGLVVIAGGTPSDSSILASVEIYEPNAGTFRAVGSMITARRMHTATARGRWRNGQLRGIRLLVCRNARHSGAVRSIGRRVCLDRQHDSGSRIAFGHAPSRRQSLVRRWCLGRRDRNLLRKSQHRGALRA